MKKNPIKLIFELLTWLVIGVFAVLAFFTVLSNTSALGGYRSFLILSGSMEPAIMIGDIILVHPQPQYLKNDTITFTAEDQRVVTHRIIEASEHNGKTVFTTKGDANRSEDNNTITPDQIIGKVALVIPKLGYLVSFSRSVPGLIILVVIPAVTIVLDELLRLING